MKRAVLAYILILVLFVPSLASAQTLTSPNYNVEGSTLDGGGESSSSANYRSYDSVSDVETGEANSTNFKTIPGFEPGAYPGVPATPTFTNTGGTLYNALDFIVATGDGQQTDTTYAIAISTDDFVTTNFIQTDDTIGPTEAWQTYSGWNSGTGERVTGLSASTTYKIKVKARYGADSESGYSQTATAATVGPTLTVSIAGVASGTTVAGVTTTVLSNAASIGYGSLTVGDGSPNIAAQTVTVSTNATGGYTATAQQDGNLRTDSGDSIAVVSGTNATPDAFGTGVTTGRFGYHTTDSTLCTGTASRFSTNDTYAALDLIPYEVACSSGPATSDVTTVVYKLVIGALQEAGNYQNVITYITTATY